MRASTLVLFALLTCVPLSHAESSDSTGKPGVLARLGTPAQEAVVNELLSELRAGDTDAAVRLAHALGHAGGCGAVPGIVHLLDHGADEVRLAAMEAAGRTGLRVEALRKRLRRTVGESPDPEVIVAVEALGHVGDGRDVPTLLELVESENARLRAAAFHALEALTGAKVPLVRARWTWYWKGFRKRAESLLPQVLAALEDAVDGPDREALAALVRRYGWVDAAELSISLREWLVSPDRELRRIACALVGELRLADLAPDVREYRRFAAQREQRETAEKALAALGYRVEDARVNTPAD